MNTKSFVVIMFVVTYVLLFVLVKKLNKVIERERNREELKTRYRIEVDADRRDREITKEYLEDLSEQLLRFVFDVSKVAELPVDVEFEDVGRSMFWAIHGDDGVQVKVKGLDYEVGEHVVIKGDTQELLLKVIGIDKTDKVNETTVLRCDYASSREKKDRHSYADLYKMSYLMQSELDNVKEVVLNQNTMRRHEIEDLEKELKELVSDMQDKLTKESQEYGKWTQELVDAVTVLLEGKIKQLDKEVKELRREVALGADE